MLVFEYKTKKELKLSVGQRLRYAETSFFGEEYQPTGILTGVGPSAYDRKWYARVAIRNGKIERVS